MISSDQFFIISIDFSSSNLHMFKFTFSNTSTDWSRKIVCSLVSWYTSFSESLLSGDSSTIYLLFGYGSLVSKYMHFVALSTSDGTTVNTRYKSSATVINVWGLVLFGDSIVNSKIYFNWYFKPSTDSSSMLSFRPISKYNYFNILILFLESVFPFINKILIEQWKLLNNFN